MALVCAYTCLNPQTQRRKDGGGGQDRLILEGLSAKLQKGKRVRRLVAHIGVLLAAAGLGTAAQAQGWDGTIAPYQAFPGNAQFDLNASAEGALFSPHGGQRASGAFKLSPRLHRDYDSGLVLGLNATLTASDVLSRGRYDGDVIEKIYGDVRTGLGRLEIGQSDGGAYDLAISGPKVDAAVSLDNPQITFFRYPSTGRAFTDIFSLHTQIGASSNYAKFSYVSPNLLGAQLALSFTPNQAKLGIPFLHAGPHVPGRQVDIWEGAIKYSDEFGDWTLSAYGGGAWGRGEHKLPGQEGVSDLGAGLRADYQASDEMMVSLGGAWRQSNAYAFHIARSFQANTSSVMQASGSISYGDWVAGVEVGSGDAGSVGAMPHLGLDGYQASLGYVLGNSIQVTGGWQRLTHHRSSGKFYNGAPHIGLDAGFLHLTVKTSN